MSAWDITGAVLWTPLAVWFWTDVARGKLKPDSEHASALIWMGLALSAGSVFSIARMCGAHA